MTNNARTEGSSGNSGNDGSPVDRDGKGGTDNATKPRLPLPHDRDEAADQQGHPVEPVIEQAGKDVEQGLKDTDLRGTAAEKFDRKFGPRDGHGTP